MRAVHLGAKISLDLVISDGMPFLSNVLIDFGLQPPPDMPTADTDINTATYVTLIRLQHFFVDKMFTWANLLESRSFTDGHADGVGEVGLGYSKASRFNAFSFTV